MRQIIAQPEAMTIGELARQTGVSSDTIRYYERIGLMPRAQRTPGGYCDYPAGAGNRITVIRNAVQLGFPLQEVARVLRATHGELPPGAAEMSERKQQIAYRYVEQPAGASVVIETTDAATRDAVHAFLRYQIVEHKTGDPLTVQ